VCGTGTYSVHTNFYRVFKLSDYNVTGAFDVTGVDFLVSGAQKSPQMAITIATYSGTEGGDTLSMSDIGATLGTASVTLPTITTAQNEHVPVTATVPAGSTLLLEVAQTNEGSTGDKVLYYPGANAAGESEPGYWMSPDNTDGGCPTVPTSMTESAGTETDLVMTVTGTY
jgi:hypothetical protein